ncbi:putative alpha/beta superfamily hydrolase [Paenibacillus sp. DS2015]|uniref:alpha/beta hydrolase n=1 Tax=Paenibacillus sp. DS2015 TaxID=3373917 RepID=UPI003D199E17
MDHKEIEQAQVTIKDSTDDKVTIPRTEQRIMHDRTGNREYRIFVAIPSGETPPLGYPVIYLLDANAIFGTMVEAIRVQARRTEKTGVVPAIIVGIGYLTEEPFSPARHYDFTLPASLTELPTSPDGRAWPKQGGAEDFLTFIQEDLKPEIERKFTVDRNRQTIFGHSLGGLFVLHVLFTKPEAFQTYVAGSPSIHWNKRFMHEEEQLFTARLEEEPVNIRILIGMGELEKYHKSRIYENAKDLSERLAKLAKQGVHVEFKGFEDEGHGSVLPALISRALRFASRSALVSSEKT